MTVRKRSVLATPYVQDKLSGMGWKRFWSIWNIACPTVRKIDLFYGGCRTETAGRTDPNCSPDIMGALQKRIESYARVRRMWRFRKWVCGQYAGRDGPGIGDGDAAGQDLAGTMKKQQVIEQETKQMGKLVLIDGHSILNPGILRSARCDKFEGTHTNAVYGF